MQTELLMCWSDMTDTEQTTSGSNEDGKQYTWEEVNILMAKSELILEKAFYHRSYVLYIIQKTFHKNRLSSANIRAAVLHQRQYTRRQFHSQTNSKTNSTLKTPINRVPLKKHSLVS